MKLALPCALLASLLLCACGGGGGGSESPGSTPLPTPSPTPTPDPNYIQGQALINWRLPSQRENGTPLLPQEIGGFEIRYRKAGDPEFTYIIYEGIDAQSHTFEDLLGVYEFQIAAYDTNGLYSQFVALTAMH